jgi:chromosome segregation ATPase
MEKQLEDLSYRTGEIVTSQEAMLLKSVEDMKRKALEISGEKLEEYRRAQEAEFRRLETLADDSRNLDTELRRNMQEVVERIREDFSQFEKDSSERQRNETEKLSVFADDFRKEFSGLENELSDLKAKAYEGAIGKIKDLEEELVTDLDKRSSVIDQQLLEWQEKFDNRLTQIGDEAETQRIEVEHGFSEDMRDKLSAQNSRLVSELGRLKAETDSFEDGIRAQINAADEAVLSYKELLDNSLQEARKEAEISIKAEISKQSLTTSETLKQYQRDVEGRFREMFEFVGVRNNELSALLDASHSELEEAGGALTGKLRELDDTVEEARRRVRELSLETDNRIGTVRSSVEDAERHIREAVDQTKLIDKADELRLSMERRIEDLRADIDRLDQRRAEAVQLENDFVKIKRLEDDVNAKMTRFLSEKRRIETMEGDFNRLLQISKSVEEKLASLTESNDILQAMQLQIRKLEESLGHTEEKYQRIEKKSQILDNTNDGIDRNFKILQDSEKLSARISVELDHYSEELEAMQASIEKLSAESERAREAAENLNVLDNAIEEIEGRIKSMRSAQVWVAEIEKRLEELNRDAQTQMKAIDTIIKSKKSGADAIPDEGALTPKLKENVIALGRQGWTDDKIAKAMKISLGEVELILEMAPRD